MYIYNSRYLERVFVHIYSINGGGGAAGGGGISLSILFGVPGGRGPIGVSGGMAPSESSPLLYDESESSLLLSKCIFGGRGGVLELWAIQNLDHYCLLLNPPGEGLEAVAELSMVSVC